MEIQKELRLQLMEDEISLEEIQVKLSEAKHKYDIISMTSEYMMKAKEQLAVRYMEPIMDGFTRFYSYISTDYLDEYDVDANINVTRKEFGERRKSESLSQGYQDLINISLRMALIEVMYSEEKPFVVFDDPFTNLDTEKMEQAKSFLEEVAREYQVIYFTCHESRA